MGMFTTVIDGSGFGWQIKTGYDECEVIRVGQDVSKLESYGRKDDYFPGSYHLQDAIYEAYFDGVIYDEAWGKRAWKEGVDQPPDVGVDRAWIVIQGGGHVHGPFPIDKERTYLQMYALWNIGQPDPSLWSDEVWAAKAKRDYVQGQERLLDQAATEFMTGPEAFAYYMSKMTRRQMRETGFTRQILPTEEQLAGMEATSQAAINAKHNVEQDEK